jgi:hypothetical protein
MSITRLLEHVTVNSIQAYTSLTCVTASNLIHPYQLLLRYFEYILIILTYFFFTHSGYTVLPIITSNLTTIYDTQTNNREAPHHVVRIAPILYLTYIPYATENWK